MSLWNIEVLRIDGQLYAHVRIQNDYTGNISGSVRKVINHDGHYYIHADTNKHVVDQQVSAFIERENLIKSAIDFYKKYKGVYSV